MTLVRVFFICCIVVAASAKNEEEVKKIFMEKTMECTKEIKIDSEELQLLLKRMNPRTREMKCFAACVMKKIDWIDSKGMYNENAAVRMSEVDNEDKHKVENAKKLYASCRHVNDKAVSDGESGCERAAMLVKCITENAPKFGFST